MSNKYSVDNYGKVPMIFSYDTFDLKKVQIKAVTIDAEGCIYLYDFHTQSFRETTEVGSNFIDYTPHMGGLLGIVAERHRLENRKLYAQYVEKYQILEKLVEDHLEEKAGILIRRVVNVKEIGKSLYVKYRFVNEKGEADSDIFELPNHINGYTVLKAILEKQMEQSKGTQGDLEYSKPCRVEIACIILFGIVFLADLVMLIHFSVAAGNNSVKMLGSMGACIVSICIVVCLGYRVIRKR